MGDPKRSKKKYDTPKKMWDIKRVTEDRATTKKYGLKNKQEIWRAQKKIRGKRNNARKLLAMELDERIKREKELMESMHKLGLLSKNATLDDVLSLTVENILDRRLQTITFMKGLAKTQKQARQLITHGKIKIGARRVTVPGYIVSRDEEDKIDYADKALEAKLKPKTKAKKLDFKKENIVPKELDTKQKETTKEMKKEEPNVEEKTENPVETKAPETPVETKIPEETKVDDTIEEAKQ